MVWAFDNDGTLYDDFETGRQFKKLATAYFSRLLHLPAEDVSELGEELKRRHGTDFSAIAFSREYGLDLAEIIDETYLKIDLAGCGPSPRDRSYESLPSLKGERIVFTNNPAGFARRVLTSLGIEHLFSDIIGMEELLPYAKPDIGAYRLVAERYIGSPFTFCDDTLANLAPARMLGWQTVWFNPACTATEHRGHRVVRSFAELPLG